MTILGPTPPHLDPRVRDAAQVMTLLRNTMELVDKLLVTWSATKLNFKVDLSMDFNLSVGYAQVLVIITTVPVSAEYFTTSITSLDTGIYKRFLEFEIYTTSNADPIRPSPLGVA